jgi:hypothetical protein
MLVREAIECLDGHAVMSPDSARQVCEAIGVDFNERLVMSWQTAQEAIQTLGFFPVASIGQGVDGLDLSYHIAEQLNLGRPGAGFTGRGFQSRANQQAIRQKLSEAGKL